MSGSFAGFSALGLRGVAACQAFCVVFLQARFKTRAFVFVEHAFACGLVDEPNRRIEQFKRTGGGCLRGFQVVLDCGFGLRFYRLVSQLFFSVLENSLFRGFYICHIVHCAYTVWCCQLSARAARRPIILTKIFWASLSILWVLGAHAKERHMGYNGLSNRIFYARHARSFLEHQWI